MAQYQKMATGGRNRYWRGGVFARSQRQSSEHPGWASRIGTLINIFNNNKPRRKPTMQFRDLGKNFTRLCAFSCLLSFSALAHHSTAAFDNEKVVKIEGTITQF